MTWLHTYQAAFSKRSGKVFIPQEIVTDFSLSLIYAVIGSFQLGVNTYDEYLQKYWDILNDKDAPNDKKRLKRALEIFVHLYLSACHVKKISYKACFQTAKFRREKSETVF